MTYAVPRPIDIAGAGAKKSFAGWEVPDAPNMAYGFVA